MGLMDRWGRRGEGGFRGGAFWVGMVEPAGSGGKAVATGFRRW